MAGGPIFPNSAYPVTSGMVFPNFHAGAGSGSKYDEGLGLADATTLSADATWALRFHMPPTLPTGTGKLRILSLANATTGDVVVDPQWVSVAVNEDPSVATPVAEGNSTISFTAADDYKETKITLDADTLVASEVVAMNLVFKNTGTTLAVNSTHIVSIIWE